MSRNLQKRTSNSTTPKSPRGVNFFQQFTRQFLRPYGEADSAPSIDTVFRRIQPFTCEWLLRPKVAISELSETIIKNLKLLSEDNSGLMTRESMTFLQHHLTPLTGCLSRLGKEHDGPILTSDIVDTLKFLYQENDELDSAMDNMFELGGALFTMSCQYIVARTLVRCPENYAQAVQAEDASDCVFQQRKDIASMRDFIVNNIVGTRRAPATLSHRRNLISAFDMPVNTEASISPSPPSSCPMPLSQSQSQRSNQGIGNLSFQPRNFTTVQADVHSPPSTSERATASQQPCSFNRSTSIPRRPFCFLPSTDTLDRHIENELEERQRQSGGLEREQQPVQQAEEVVDESENTEAHVEKHRSKKKKKTKSAMEELADDEEAIEPDQEKKRKSRK